MAEFSMVANEFNRMCDYYDKPPCEGCPMQAHGIDKDACRQKLLDKPHAYEERISSWAKEHPECEYPTWAEWLSDVGVMGRGNFDIEYYIKPELFKPIPNYYAAKLGLEQKEKK